MRLKVLALTALIVCIFATVPAFALEAGFVYAPESLSPGKAERICISVDTDCAITLELLDSQGNIAYTLRSNLQIGTGMLNLTYNGLAPASWRSSRTAYADHWRSRSADSLYRRSKRRALH